MAELNSNARLYYAVEICGRLGIDDPVYWMDRIQPKTLDLWIAWMIKKDQDAAKMWK